MGNLLYALQFLTRLPVPDFATPPEESAQGRVALYYPLVGLIIGLLLCLLLPIIGDAGSGVQAALVLVCWVGVTGAMHLDGLADLGDSWVGGLGDRQRTLEIMKDPASGPVGVASLVSVLLLKFAALDALLLQGEWLAVLVAPVIGRAGMVAALRDLPYVRAGGLGSNPSRYLPKSMATAVVVISLLIPLLVWGWQWVPVLLALVLSYLWLRKALASRLGGITGDCLGGICELLEAITLTGLALAI